MASVTLGLRLGMSIGFLHMSTGSLPDIFASNPHSLSMSNNVQLGVVHTSHVDPSMHDFSVQGSDITDGNRARLEVKL